MSRSPAPWLALIVWSAIAATAGRSSSASDDAPTDPQPLWDCGQQDRSVWDKVNACRADCTKTSNAADEACADAVRSCVAGCSGDDEAKKSCRADCKATLRTCTEKARSDYTSCLDSCVTSNGCNL